MWTKIKKVFLYLLFAFYAVSFTLFVYRFINVMSFPYDIVAGEGMVYGESVKISSWEQIYKDINQRPYYISNYPPIYQMVCAGAMAITGKQTLFIGRFISALSTAGVIILIYLIVLRLSRSKLAGMFAVLSFCSFWYIFDYAPYFRVDMLGLLFGLLGLYWVHLYGKTNKVYFAVIFLVLSIFTKQSYIFAPISGVLYLFIMNQKRGAIFAVLMLVSVLSLIAFGNALTQGQFQKHIFMSFQGDFDFGRSMQWFSNFVRTYFAYIALVVYAVYKQISNKEMTPYIFYLFLAIIPMVAVGRTGGYSNYYFEICLAIAIQTGIGFAILFRSFSHKTIAIALFILCFQMNNLTAIDFDGEYLKLSRKPGWTLMPTKENAAKRKRIAETVKKCGGKAISETSEIYLISKNTPMEEYHGFLKYYIPAWDPSSFIADLNAGRYNCIITEEDYGAIVTEGSKDTVFEKEKRIIIAGDFHLKESVDKINIYERN